MGNQKKMAAAWQNASRLNRCWRARTYHWQHAGFRRHRRRFDCGAPASAYNCFAEARLGPLVQCSRQATLARQFAPVDPSAILQSSYMQRQASLNRRRWRLTPAVASDRFSRATSDSDAMHFARLQPFSSDCLFFQRARTRIARIRSWQNSGKLMEFT